MRELILSGLPFLQGKMPAGGVVLLLGAQAACLLCIVLLRLRGERRLRKVEHIIGRYMAPQVVHQILNSGEAGLRLGGTRRILTILFVDIRGFSMLSETAEPEEVVAILNEYLNLTAGCILRYEGTLDKFIGDAAMAVFNAPFFQEDHPMKAVQAAWAMKEGAAGLERRLMDRYGRQVQFGIGIHTGPAVFGNIGSLTRMDYTAVGDAVNTAARLESLAKPGQILISETTYEAVKDRIRVSSPGKLQMKGKEQEIVVYELEGVV